VQSLLICRTFRIRNWSHYRYLSLLLLLVFFSFLLGRPSSKKPKDWVWKCGVGFLIWRHNFKMATLTSFHTENCCHLVSPHAASARRICSSVRQFLIHSTIVVSVLLMHFVGLSNVCQTALSWNVFFFISLSVEVQWKRVEANSMLKWLTDRFYTGCQYLRRVF